MDQQYPLYLLEKDKLFNGGCDEERDIGQDNDNDIEMLVSSDEE